MPAKKKATVQDTSSPLVKRARARADKATTVVAKPAGKAAATPQAAAARPAAFAERPLDAPMHAALAGGAVHEDWDAALMQTNLDANANKFLRQQIVRMPNGTFYVHRRWGRVGYAGEIKKTPDGPFACSAQAEREFEKYIKEKTGYAWASRADKLPLKPGKYSLFEIEEDAELADKQHAASLASSVAPSPAKAAASLTTAPCSLPAPTQTLVKLIFERETLSEAMRLMEVDLARLPLGALSNKQLELGEAALEAVEAALGAQPRPSASELVRLTSAFYQAIPHAFGFAKPPLLDSAEAVRKKWEMLHTLADIDAANRMQADADDAAAASKGKGKGAAATAHALRPHPVDACYAQLACGLELLGEAGASAADGAELAMLRAYAEQSLGGTAPQLLHAWRADRQGEGARFAAHALLDNHKLLWHGTNVAVVAAILKSGLRIMPHAGGRVGRGIYLADCQAKSASYVQPAGGHAVMFLVEAALGSQHVVDRDGPHASGLVAAPAGFDSVLAKGQLEPDPSKHATLALGGRAVVVPQGALTASGGAGASSSFTHNEYLIYKESQHRIRYVLMFKWTY